MLRLFIFENPLLPERTERCSIGDSKSKTIEYLSGDCDLDYKIYLIRNVQGLREVANESFEAKCEVFLRVKHIIKPEMKLVAS
jgi:hypothetical protein